MSLLRSGRIHINVKKIFSHRSGLLALEAMGNRQELNLANIADV